MRKREMVKRIEALAETTGSLRMRVTRLECPHKNFWFGRRYDIGEYAKTCNDCGEMLVTYSSKKAMLAAKLEYVNEQNKKNLDAVKKEIANGKSNS